MKKIFISSLVVTSFLLVGCECTDVQTTPPQTTSFQANIPQIQTCDACANQTSTKITKILPTEKKVIQNVITVNPKPICTCPSIPMVPANYFVTYEPLNDYPVTYKTKYTEPCSCY